MEQRTYAYQNSTDEFYQSPVYTPSPLYSPQKRELDSPYRSTGHSVYDISSTDGSYGSALRPFGDNNRKRFSTIPEIPDRKNIIVPRRQSVLMATVVRSAAPMKVYWDATATASSLDIWLDDNTKECQDAFNASLVSVRERERERDRECVCVIFVSNFIVVSINIFVYELFLYIFYFYSHFSI